jgi:hypothetical protein
MPDEKLLTNPIRGFVSNFFIYYRRMPMTGGRDGREEEGDARFLTVKN